MSHRWPSLPISQAFTIYRPRAIDPELIMPMGPRPVFSEAGLIGYSEFDNHPDPQIVMVSRGETCGRIFVTDDYAWLTGDLLVIRAKIGGVMKSYALHYFRWLMQRPELIRMEDGPVVDRALLHKQPFVLPSWEKQKEIVHYLDEAEAMGISERFVGQARSEAFRFREP